MTARLHPLAPSPFAAVRPQALTRVLVPLAILLFAAAMRLAGLDKSLWIDEASSYYQATAPGFMAAARNYDHPPLYFALLRIGLRFTQSFALLRLFSVVCGLAGVAMFCFWPDRQSRSEGWLAGLLLASAPGFVSNSQELRQYALLSAAFVAALACAWRLIRAPEDKLALLGLAGALLIAAATHLITGFFLIALGAWLFWHLRHSRRHLLLNLAGGLAPAAILLAYLKLHFLLGSVKDHGAWWMPPVSPGLLGRIFGEITGWNALSWTADACERHVPGSGPAFLVVAAAACAFVAWSAWVHRSADAARGLLAIAAIYWSAAIAYSLAVTPILWPRTMLPGMLPCFLALALGISAHPVPRRRIAARSVAALLAAAMVVPWLRGLAWRSPENLHGMVAAVRAHTGASDLLVLLNGVEYGFEPYWPAYQDVSTLRIDSHAPVALTLGELEAARERFSHRDVLLVYRDDLYLAPNRPALDAIVRVLSGNSAPPEELWNQDSYHVLRFHPSGSP